MQDTILRVDNLDAEFDTADGVVKAVNHVSFELPRGSTLAITGESGSGKSSVALSIKSKRSSPSTGRFPSARRRR